ncbi:unnamed protein product [Ostreobium quekettii]|uniref:Uncharacterized protein n=1 Tax=Ostreobium quekettii TaxID=121088 RepID=A0A8S1J6M6_9CHLO|nr:unnamed protein product [Ostreobium quekettii]
MMLLSIVDPICCSLSCHHPPCSIGKPTGRCLTVKQLLAFFNRAHCSMLVYIQQSILCSVYFFFFIWCNTNFLCFKFVVLVEVNLLTAASSFMLAGRLLAVLELPQQQFQIALPVGHINSCSYPLCECDKALLILLFGNDWRWTCT